MKRTTSAAALAAALAGLLVASPARAENDSEYARGLVKLRWYDLAERLLKKIGEQNKAEAALGWAYLYQDRGDRAPTPREQIELYEKALAAIDDFQKAAGGRHPALPDALNLRGSIMQAQGRPLDALIADPRTDAAERTQLVEKRNKIREQATAAFSDAVAKAEAAYAAALKDWREPKNDSRKTEPAKRKAWEEYVTATQMFVNKLIRDAEMQEPGGTEQKSAGKLIHTKVDEWLKRQADKYEALGDDSAGVTMYMNYALGRGYAYAGDMTNAVKNFDEVTKYDPNDFSEGPPRTYVTALKLHSMFFKADGLALGAKTEADWRNVQKAIGFELFQNMPGSDPVMAVKARILRARSQANIGDTTPAMEELYRAMEAAEKHDRENEARGRNTNLRGLVLEALARMVVEQILKGIEVPAAPDVLVRAGGLCYSQERYEEAAKCFRAAIARARKPEIMGDPQKRYDPDSELSAWLMLGNSYLRMSRANLRGSSGPTFFLEAQLAYEGALQGFFGEDGKAIPDQFAKDPRNAQAMVRVRGLLRDCANMGTAAAREERGLSPRARFNNDQYERWLDWQIKIDPDQAQERDWFKGQRLLEEARRAMEEARVLDRERKSAEAGRKRKEALDNYLAAEQVFLGLPDKSRYKGDGFYYAGMACYSAMGALGYRGHTEEDRQKAEDLAGRALKHFDEYEAWVKANPPRGTSPNPAQAAAEASQAQANRRKFLANIALTRPFIYLELGRFEDALKTAEALRGRDDLDPAQIENLHQLLFKCYTEVAIKQAEVAKIKEMLEKAEGDVNWFKAQMEKAPEQDKDRLKALYAGNSGKLSGAYDKAMKVARDKNAPEVAKLFWKKKADWLKGMIGGEDVDVPIDRLWQIGTTYYEVGEFEEARKAFERLLSKFDPEGDRVGESDEKLVFLASYDKMKEAVKPPAFPDVENMRAGRAELERIRLKTIGGEIERKTEEGLVREKVEKNYDQAVELIARFLEAHGEYDKAGNQPGEARRALEALRAELEFRLKLLKASLEISTCYVELGKQALAENRPEDAKTCFQNGLDNAEAAIKYWPKNPEVMLNKARCLVASEDKARKEEGVKVCQELRRGSPGNSELWWTASRLAAEAMIGLAKYEDARALMAPMIITSSKEDIESYWPNLVDEAVDLAVNKIKYDKDPQKALEKFVGKKVTFQELDYRPKSELEKLAELHGAIIREGRDSLKGANAELRLGLLKELVELSASGALKAAQDPPDDILLKIVNGRITSLQTLGGKSRGEANDKNAPAVKSGADKGAAGAGKAAGARE